MGSPKLKPEVGWPSYGENTKLDSRVWKGLVQARKPEDGTSFALSVKCLCDALCKLAARIK